jgi:hypothetical protein
LYSCICRSTSANAVICEGQGFEGTTNGEETTITDSLVFNVGILILLPSAVPLALNSILNGAVIGEPKLVTRTEKLTNDPALSAELEIVKL